MSGPPLPESLKNHPRLGQWLGLTADGHIQARTGKAELGQGISHALRLIVAEELGLAPSQVYLQRPTTDGGPDEAVTAGSLSVQHSGGALRLASAHLRERCRQGAAARAGVQPALVTLQDGRFCAGTLRLAYADLLDAPLLNEQVDPQHLAARAGRASAHADALRDDIASKVFGRFEYLQDMAPEGMLRGRVYHPPTLQAQFDEAVWLPLQARLGAIAGVVDVVRDGLLVGVLAQTAEALARSDAAVQSSPLWTGSVQVPEPHAVSQWLKSQPIDSVTLIEQPARPDGQPAVRHFRAEYGRYWLQHASIGLCCAIAQWEQDSLQVWSHSQGIYNLRRDLALAFTLPAQAIQVHHREGAGCYGHNGADDVAFDAAWLGRHAGGRPVRVEWTRDQEMGNAPLAPAMVVEVQAAVDAQGRLLSWAQEVWSQGHGTRPGRGSTPSLLGAWQVTQPAPVVMAVNQPPATGGGGDRNAVPPYAIGQVQVRSHRVLSMPMRVSAMRSLGAHVNVLAAESMVDEIARYLGRDPLAYRLDHLEDERARAVLREAARLAGWTAGATLKPGYGRGIAYARYKHTGAYCAVVAELVVEETVRLRKLSIAADLGLVVHPDGARNQIEGGAIQTASWTLREAADLGEHGIRSTCWETYPILGFTEVPHVAVSLLDRPDLPSMGAGECSGGPTAAAIANAIDNALGLRMRMMPFTDEALMRAAQDAPDH